MLPLEAEIAREGERTDLAQPERQARSGLGPLLEDLAAVDPCAPTATPGLATQRHRDVDALGLALTGVGHALVDLEQVTGRITDVAVLEGGIVGRKRLQRQNLQRARAIDAPPIDGHIETIGRLEDHAEAQLVRFLGTEIRLAAIPDVRLHHGTLGFGDVRTTTGALARIRQVTTGIERRRRRVVDLVEGRHTEPGAVGTAQHDLIDRTILDRELRVRRRTEAVVVVAANGAGELHTGDDRHHHFGVHRLHITLHAGEGVTVIEGCRDDDRACRCGALVTVELVFLAAPIDADRGEHIARRQREQRTRGRRVDLRHRELAAVEDHALG